MAIPMQNYKGIKEIPYPSNDMIQRWSSRDHAGEIRLLNETGKWQFDPPLNINDLEIGDSTDSDSVGFVRYNDLSSDNFRVSESKEVSLNVDYITLSNFSGKDYIQPDPLPSARINLSSTSVTVLEGGNTDVSIYLEREPTSDVVLSVTSLDTGIASVSTNSLTFTPSNFDTPQSVQINGVVDDNAYTDYTQVKVSVDSTTDSNYTNLSSKYIDVKVSDTDSADFIISKSSLSIDEGAQSTFTVQLTSEPQADVTVRLTSIDTDIATIDVSSITFTDTSWDSPVTVTISALEDDIVGDLSTSISVEVYQTLDPDYESLPDKSVGITVIDNDGTNASEVQIGNTIWKTSNETWDDGGDGIYYPDNDINNTEEYGLLYTYSALQRLLSANPDYRVPNSNDLSDLVESVPLSLYGDYVGTLLYYSKDILKYEEYYWEDYTGDSWIPSTDLNFVPAGQAILSYSNPYISFNERAVNWRTMINSDGSTAYYYYDMYYSSSADAMILRIFKDYRGVTTPEDIAYSVRLVKDR